MWEGGGGLRVAEQGLDEQPAARSHDDDGCDPRLCIRTCGLDPPRPPAAT